MPAAVSLVALDEGGMLQVGPRSAGADPGPACYGKGGIEPTLTDAHVVLGTIRPAAFLGGRMTINSDAAARAFEAPAGKLRMSVPALTARAVPHRRGECGTGNRACLDRAGPGSA